MGQVSRELLMMFCFVLAGAMIGREVSLWITIPFFIELVILGNLFLILNNKFIGG